MSYVVMRLLTGGTLEDKITQKGKFAPKEALRLLTPLADALEYAHQKGVLHRDIKPSNIMFDDQNRPYLVDFGLAKLANQNLSLTASGFMIGTPNYMSPEQWKGETLTPASDQYAFATMTYEVLTGKMPFDADSTYALMHKHLHETPSDTTEKTRLSKPIYAVILRGMSKNPDERYPSVKAFMKALIGAVESGAGVSEGQFTPPMKQPDVSQPTPPFIIAQKKPFNRLWIWMGVLILGIAIIAMVIGVTRRANPTDINEPLPTRIIINENTPTPSASATPEQPIVNNITLTSARRALEEENYRLALSLYTRVIENNPNIAQLYYERALAYYGLNRDTPAMNDLDEAIRLNPSFALAYLLRARIYGDNREYDEALASLNNYLALEASPVPEAVTAKGTLEALVTP
jgi:serine/threonine protein kinase